MAVDMSSISVDLRGSEASEIFLEPVFTDPSIISQFRLMPSVTSRKKMVFVEDLEKIVRRYAGCGLRPVGSFNIYERSVSVEKVGAYIEQCWDEFKDTILEELMNRGVRFADLTDTILGDIMRQRMMESVQRDIVRLSYFGNLASQDPSYNTNDGLWEVFYPQLVAQGLIPRCITGSGSDITSNNGIDILSDVYNQSDVRLKKLPNNLKQFNVSGTVWEAYRNDLEVYGGADGGRMQLINGVETLYFRGIVVNPIYDWNIYKDEVSGTTKNHLVEYTTRLNKVIATDIATGLPDAQYKIWFNEDEEKMKAKTSFKFGVNFIHPSLISVGY
jgi:hypothetical protein